MRKVCRRKIWALVNPIEHAIAGAAVTSGADLNAIRFRELSAIEAFARGNATAQEWADLVAMMNVARTMGGSDPACDAARVALDDSKARADATGRWGMTGPGLQAMRVLYANHEAQRTGMARSAYEEACQKTINRVKNLEAA
jgi:hypothetical protein